MEEYIIPGDNGKGITKAFIGGDIEFVNPIEYYSDWEIKRSISLERTILNLKNPVLTSFISDEWFMKRAAQKWDERYKIIRETEIPENFVKLFEAESKKDQIRLLQGQSLTPHQLAALIFKAWTGFGYSFSNYIGEHHHKGLDESKLPTFIHAEDGKFRTAGETSLSEGQLRQVVEHRKVTVSKFLDKEDRWHCFFLTYKSLRGEEGWKDGQPHFHYISDKWGIQREDAVEQLKSEKYPSTSVHIDLLEYDDKSRASLDRLRTT